MKNKRAYPGLIARALTRLRVAIAREAADSIGTSYARGGGVIFDEREKGRRRKEEETKTRSRESERRPRRDAWRRAARLRAAFAISLK